MNQQRFDQLLNDLFEEKKTVLGAKAGEYATDSDRLHNFKVAAALQGCTPETALIGMWAKHVVSVVDLVKKLENGYHTPMAVWKEKIGDSSNDLDLLMGLLLDRASR